MPIDVVKTRLQMDGSGGSIKQYNGTIDCAGKMVKAEGPGALFKGLPPALVRQSTYGSLRYGLYGPIRDSLGARRQCSCCSAAFAGGWTRVLVPVLRWRAVAATFAAERRGDGRVACAPLLPATLSHSRVTSVARVR